MCTAGCPTPGAHNSWGDCVRSKRVQMAPPETGIRKNWDAGLQAYRDARRQGLQPQKPTWDSVEREKRVADAVLG